MTTPDIRPNTARRTVLLVMVTAVLTIIATFGALYGTGALQLHNRQAEVAARGAQVMPFDLEQTTHIFQPLADGGLQQVIVKDPAATGQIDLIRMHLQEEAGKFTRGDFSDPTAIHGHEMPGLAELRAGASDITVVYDTLPNGAQIRYTTDDPTLITALHTWFQAQVSDHGHHATMQ